MGNRGLTNGKTEMATKGSLSGLSEDEFLRSVCLPVEDLIHLRRRPLYVDTFHNVRRYFRSKNVIDTYKFRDCAELERIGRMLRGRKISHQRTPSRRS
jgi:hypothetical protein